MLNLKTLLAGGLLLAGVSTANAGVSVDVHIGNRPPPPVCGPAYEAFWVPPVTQTSVVNVWHEPVTEERTAQQWVPDQYEWRDVTVADSCGRPVTTKQNVLVAPAHYETVRTQVVVRAGYYGPEAQTTEIVPGHWETRPVIVRGYGPRYYGRYDRYDGPRHDYHDRYDRHDRWHR